MNLLVFDIETVPDTKIGKVLYNLDTNNQKNIADIMFEKQNEKTGRSFLPHHLQKIVVISCALRIKDQFKIGSVAQLDSDESTLIESFFKCLEKYTPTLISWNGCGFDLPVLHYRSLLYGISCPRYWDNGSNISTGFRWNNYLNRYHYRHSDLMDILSAYQARAYAPLTEVAIMLGLPGKIGMEGHQVWDSFLQGQIEAIRNYCEVDVLNTYLIYLRFELIRGNLSPENYKKECGLVYDILSHENKAHFKQFINAWKI